MAKCSATCQCGSVKITLGHKPDFINDCNCSLCTCATGAWGYFNTDHVRVTGQTKPYVRPDRPNPIVELHSCVICGDTTHWHITAGYKQSPSVTDQMGVNMRHFAATDLVGVEVRFPDGKAWSGEGDYTYRQPHEIISL